MTDQVPEDDRRSRYVVTAPSGQTVFDIGFSNPITAADELTVYVDGAVQSSGFTVSVSAGTVTFDSAVAQDAIVTIEGAKPVKRVNGYPLRGDLKSSLLNTDLDAVITMIQELRRDIDRTVIFNPAEADGVSNQLPLFTANRALVVNSAGDGITLSDSNINNLDDAVADAEAAQTAAENAQSYAEEWATRAEDSLIPVAAGGNGTTDYSALHHAAKAEASATAAAASAQNAADSAASINLPALGNANELLGVNAGGTDYEYKSASDLVELVGPLLYPVGSIYINRTSSTNPATLLGFGTWTAIEDKVIRARGSTYTSDGGSDSVTLAEANLPSHTHGAGTLTTNSAGSHSHSFNTVGSGGSPFSTAVGGGPGSSNGAGTNSAGSHSHSISGSTAAAGSGTAFSVRNEDIVAYVWERTA